MADIQVNDVQKVDGAKNLRNFKASTEVESFYRFINDNSLRNEAKMILSKILKIIKPAKRKRRSRKKAALLQ